MLIRFIDQTNKSDTLSEIPLIASVTDCLSGYCLFRIRAVQYAFPTEENHPFQPVYFPDFMRNLAFGGQLFYFKSVHQRPYKSFCRLYFYTCISSER